MVDLSESIVREAPEIEAYKLGLLQSGKTLADTPLKLPEQQIAGFSGAEQEAFGRAGEVGGIGGYQALAGLGRGTLGSGVGTLDQARGAIGTAQGYLGDSRSAIGQAGRDPPTRRRASPPPQRRLFSTPTRMSLFSRL